MKIYALGLFFLTSLCQLNADETTELSGVHLCCNGCVKAIDKAVQKTGASSTCDKAEKTVTIKAKDANTMRKALKAVSDSGYYGESKGQYKITSIESSNKVIETVALEGFHNCCKKCTTGMSKAVESVGGVKNHSIKEKKRDFTVEGKFKLNELLKAINEHGFSVSVK